MAEPVTNARPAGKRSLGLNLAGGTGAANMLTHYWACLLGILLQAFVPQMQPYLLTEFLHIPEGEQGVVSDDLAFLGEVAIILMVGVWGTLSDRIRRRPIMGGRSAGTCTRDRADIR